MNIPMKQKQTHRHRELTYCFQGGRGKGKAGVGSWGWQMQTIIYRMCKQQGSTVYTEDYIQYPMIKHNGKE